MNLHYSREQKNSIKKANEEVIKHNSTVVCLMPVRPDTKVWYEVILEKANGVCF